MHFWQKYSGGWWRGCAGVKFVFHSEFSVLLWSKALVSDLRPGPSWTILTTISKLHEDFCQLHTIYLAVGSLPCTGFLHSKQISLFCMIGGLSNKSSSPNSKYKYWLMILSASKSDAAVQASQAPPNPTDRLNQFVEQNQNKWKLQNQISITRPTKPNNNHGTKPNLQCLTYPCKSTE